MWRSYPEALHVLYACSHPSLGRARVINIYAPILYREAEKLIHGRNCDWTVNIEVHPADDRKRSQYDTNVVVQRGTHEYTNLCLSKGPHKPYVVHARNTDLQIHGRREVVEVIRLQSSTTPSPGCLLTSSSPRSE